MRLAKYLAHAGVASRRAAEEIVRAGRITVGGETVTDPARDVDDESGVALDGEPLRAPREHVVYAVHKPAGAPHRYVFDLYALARRSGLSAGASADRVIAAVRGAVARGEAVGRFGR